ncbi:MAG: ThuA domain-containing protein, partial [Spirochaetota bacterium]
MKNILYVATGIIHPSIPLIRKVKTMIELNGQGNITRAHSVEGLKKLQTGSYDAVVLFFHRQKISGEALDALTNFVEHGGGCLAIHAASASFKKEPGYEKFLGGKFISHDVVQNFTVTPDTSSFLFGDVPPFNVKDELYIHRYSQEVTVHAVADNNGTSEPVIWTKKQGSGRICYFSLGHTSKSADHPVFKEIIRRGIT